jgi:hypothetical protein
VEARATPANWEADCVTYTRERNILNQLPDNDLWNMTIKNKALFMPFYVHASNLKNGKFDARQLLREGI